MARRGSSRLRTRRTSLFVAIGLTVSGVAAPALASDRIVAIPATSLDAALNALARQTGADIISVEPDLRSVRVAPLAGRMSLHAALRRLLDGSGYRAIMVDATSYRVVRARQRAALHAPLHAAAPRPAESGADIVVTASKQRVALSRYPGSITILSGSATPGAPIATPDMDSAARAAPVLQTTALGAGRDKIFIRGVADSSFNGATQSTASFYFGEVPLTYAGPEPDLRLYDMEGVEVLEGPQGTLYGAGAIGGIVRLNPAPADLVNSGGAVEAGVSATASGEPGFDGSARLNLPVIRGVAGLRGVIYKIRDGGYVDDPGQAVRDVNRVDTWGGRIAGRVAPGNGWDIDLGMLIQRVNARDAQYADAAASLAHVAALAQPYHSEFALGRLVVTKAWNSGLQLLSATGVSDAHSSDLFDATPTLGPPMPGGSPASPLVYSVDSSRQLLTQEIRLSRSARGGNSWVIGISALTNSDSQARQTGPSSNPVELIGVTNTTRSASLFGEGTLAIRRNLSLTLGARYTIARVDGEPSTRPQAGTLVRGRTTRRFDPTGALSWQIASRLAAFARVQTGYRTGGLAVARGIGRVSDFDPDSITVGEVGMRLLRSGATGFAASASASIAEWRDIQADLVNRRGQPFTTNLGNAHIETLEGTVDYAPIPGLHAMAAFLYTQNRVSGTLADLSRPENRRLPETPPLAGNIDLSYEWSGHGATVWQVGARTAYVGRSVLGAGDVLDISQGKYTVTSLRGGWTHNGLAASLSVENLLNSHANRFAYGNPFTFISRDQMTPVRPLTVRFGLARSW
jgi:iron complex outermembrane receptor protein